MWQSDDSQCTDESICFMQAKKTVGQYVEYISKYVEDVLQQMNNEAAMQQQLQQAQQQGGHPWPLPQH
jgi:hypothetical protein